MPETAPQAEQGNPFSLIAYLLFQVRHSLEDPGEAGRAPRWVRIARARDAQGPTDYIAKGVREAINGFSEALAYMVELTLDLQELLVQTDAAKALVEVTADFIQEATSENFIRGIETVVGTRITDPNNPNPLGGVGNIMDSLKQYMGYIPDPDDVRTLGHELYRLLCIEQLPLPRLANGRVDESKLPASTALHVDVEGSGKLRLLQWAFNQDLTVFGLGPKERPEEESFALTRLGSRRLWQTDAAKLPARSTATRTREGAQEVLFEFFFDAREPAEAKRTVDLVETHTLLEKLGYTEPATPQRTTFSAELTQRLRRFQALNGLALSGELDNATLNRLLHLDFTARNIRRARPFDAAQLPADLHLPDAPALTGGIFRLVNPGADSPEEEGLQFLTKPGHPRYRYYVAGTPLPAAGPAPVPPGGGWISDAGTGVVRGFVALQSRNVEATASRFSGDILTEGEASGGRFFFAARFTEPWVAGRGGPPAESLFPAPEGGTADGKPAPGSISRLYQWIPLSGINRPAGWELLVTASVMRRSLYQERSKTTGYPDQGRLGVEFYGSDVYTGPGSRRPLDRGRETNAELPAATVYTPRFPEAQAPTSGLSAQEVAQRRVWVKQSVDNVVVPAGAVAMLVVLEGIYQAGWDIDAYFDDVQVHWSLRKRAA